MAGYWQELEHTVVHLNPEQPKHAQWGHVWWVCRPWKNWDIFIFQEQILATWDCALIMLKHEVMAADECHDSGPHDFITVSLYIQIAINKNKLCSLAIAYACPYHNPTATIGLCAHNVDISKPLTYTTPHTWSAVVRPVGHTAKFSETVLGEDYGKEMNIIFSSITCTGKF